jgi:hypothetical protein
MRGLKRIKLVVSDIYLNPAKVTVIDGLPHNQEDVWRVVSRLLSP